MKKLKTIFIGLSVISIISCQKEPFANFTTDKDIYRPGETIHCTDVSNDAYSWNWTTPDGRTVRTQNFDYVIDINSPNVNKKITLEVSSKKGKKTSTCSKTVSVQQLILPTDYFSAGTTIYKPIYKFCGPNSNYYWKISATEGSGNCFNALLILFYGATPPLAGNYTLQPTDPTTSGTAYVQVGAPTGIECAGVVWYESNSGQLTVSYTNGKMRVVFNNIPTNSVNISGDITCN